MADVIAAARGFTDRQAPVLIMLGGAYAWIRIESETPSI
jgi:hypothetical protein